jgi:hemoglobin/transferrin/lactoferrin receptor protein
MMKWLISRLLLLAASGYLTLLYATSYQVSGIVSDAESGRPLAGVNIMVRGTMLGTTTDADGYYSLKHSIQSDTLLLCFSHIGYSRKLHSVPAASVILNIQLQKQAIDYENPILVTASRNRLESFKSTVSASVIDDEIIARSAGMSSSELLQREASVSLVGAAYHAAPSIRGLARHRVITMVDEEKISSERNVGAPGTYINPEDIQRIEIIRGPYSALYGSSAIGGVVNIVTKEWQPGLYYKNLGGSLQSSYQSSNRSWNHSATLNSQWKGQRLHLKAGWRKGENTRDAKGEEVLDTGFEERYLKSRLLLKPGSNHHLELHWRYSEGIEIGKPSYSTDVRSRHEPDDHRVYGFHYQWKNILPALPMLSFRVSRHDHRLGVIIDKHKREADSSKDKAIHNYKTMNTDDYSLRFEIRLIPYKKLTLLSGFHGFYQNNIYLYDEKTVRNYNNGLFIKEENILVLNNGQNHSNGFYLQSDMILTQKLSLNGGLRYDMLYSANQEHAEGKLERQNQALSGNLGLSYCKNRQMNLFLNIGTAFRAPQTKELFVATMTPGGMNIGNPELKPEQSFNLDLGIKFRSPRYQNSITLFRNQLENMIHLDWDSIGPERIGTFRNIGEAVILGAEWESRVTIPKGWSASLNFSVIQGQNLSDDELLPDIPPLQLNASLDRFLWQDKLNISLTGRYSAAEDQTGVDTEPAKAWFVIDAFLYWEIHKSIQLNGAVRNLFNEYYREYYQFDWMRAQGRSVILSLNLKF